MRLNARIQILVCALGLVLVQFSAFVTLPVEVAALTPHSPILIDGNADFTPANGVTGGNGTASDPYIIEGWEIDASASNGIDISNTDAFFVVRNIYVHSVLSTTAIDASNVSNGWIDNITMPGGFQGLRLNDVSDFTITNTTAGGETCLSVTNSNGLVVRGSDFLGAFDHCLEISNSENVHISENQVTVVEGGGINEGIYLENCANCSIVQNNITLLGWATAIWLGSEMFPDSSSNITVEGNNITSNGGGQGIWIWLISDPSVTIRGNTINDTSMGFICQVACPGILLYHNNFINNNEHAYDPGANLLDNGYPSGGNYWDNYTGIDNCSGPNQDICPDPDGIGDTPFIIDSDTRDRYPLMDPIGFSPKSDPAPPRDFRASLSGWNLENVSLTWTLSDDDGKGRSSVVGYEIYRNTSFDSSGLGYVLLTALPNGTASFVDMWTGEVNPNDYFYRVCAIDRFGNSTCSETQAAKFRRSLTEGLSFVSIPLALLDTDVDSVLQTLAYDRVWLFDVIDQKWTTIDMSKPYSNGPLFINPTVGLMVNVTRDSNMTVAGFVPSSTTIYLEAGWNLVGFPSFNTSYSVLDLKAATGATDVEGFDQFSSPYFLRTLQDGDILQAGMGYWIYCPAQAIWTVDIS